MKKLLVTFALLTVSAFAQVGIVKSTSGIHVPSATTLTQGSLYISGSFEMVSDGKPLSMEGHYTDDDGNVTDINNNTPSNDESLFASFGVLDNLELGLTIPFHYDGDIQGTDLKGIALGDLQLSTKGYIPLNDWLQLGLSADIFAPTGFKDKGFRSRHRWYTHPDGKTYAYTADSWAISGNAHFSADIKRVVTYNSYLGILKSIEGNNNYLLWGFGLNLFPETRFILIFEASGEKPLHTTQAKNGFLNNPFRFTPGLRIHLPYDSYLTISGDIGLGSIVDEDIEDGIPITLQTHDKDIHFTQASSPDVSIAISFSKIIDLSWNDNDNDGVIDRKDMCPETRRGLKVNERGCPIDEDQDGVLNIVDQCPYTPVGLEVDYNGCPIDSDHDGVPDYLEKCPGTPEGIAVDSTGCLLDTDGDGIDDNNDKCPSTPKHEKVGSDGCPLDQDHDGIPNNVDQCPNTPEGLSIDIFGCPLDFDGDGIPDELDKCPNTILGEKVNPWGCPQDSDLDGVPDSKDQCPDTPEGATVNAQGCRLDQDKDGIFDEDDKCPGTPEGAPIDSTGCPLDSDEDGIADWADYCPGTVQDTPVNDRGCPLNTRQNFNIMAQRIHFKGQDSTLLNSSYTALNDIVYQMRLHPSIHLEIQCSASDVPETVADRVSNERAEFIFHYLKKKGIHESRLKYQGYGKRLPATLTEKTGSSDAVRFIPSKQESKE